MSSFFETTTFSLFVVPFLIFLARVADVSLGTVRVIFIARGLKYWAFFLGFFEILIWISAIAPVLQNLDRLINIVAYAGGFAMGNFVGIWVEEKLAFGKLLVRIFCVTSAEELAKKIHDEGYGVTKTQGEGSSGAVAILYTIINRKDFEKIVTLIKKVSPKIFFTVENIHAASEGIFPPRPKK